MPTVSVITPILVDTPDKIIWLDEMLQSILAQTMQDWEVILVDDFSPLSIGELKWKYTDEKRFRWFKTGSNSGPALTRNVAVALAESEPILPLDSDDALALPTNMQHMYDKWLEDKTKIVYGDLQRQVIRDGKFEREKTYILSPYSFKISLNLHGIIPVTAMHSVTCHNAIGGWKPELEHGREDVEYIINAGKHGFCGQKIDETTLLYREHDTSRDFVLKHTRLNKEDMENKIIEIHADVFSGRYPMGCCGQTGTDTVQAQQKQAGIMQTEVIDNSVVTRLPEGKYKEEDTWWVKYYGGKRAKFDVFGIGRAEKYTVLGTGHIFEIAATDKSIFSQRSREYTHAEKLEFLRATPTSNPEPKPEPKPQLQTKEETVPQLAVIEQLDAIAIESRGLPALPPTITEVQLPTNTKLAGSHEGLLHTDWDLSDLNLGKFEELFRRENITVKLLAEFEISDLTGFDGIANNRAKNFIDQARKLIETT